MALTSVSYDINALRSFDDSLALEIPAPVTKDELDRFTNIQLSGSLMPDQSNDFFYDTSVSQLFKTTPCPPPPSTTWDCENENIINRDSPMEISSCESNLVWQKPTIEDLYGENSEFVRSAFKAHLFPCPRRYEPSSFNTEALLSTSCTPGPTRNSPIKARRAKRSLYSSPRKPTGRKTKMAPVPSVVAESPDSQTTINSVVGEADVLPILEEQPAPSSDKVSSPVQEMMVVSCQDVNTEQSFNSTQVVEQVMHGESSGSTPPLLSNAPLSYYPPSYLPTPPFQQVPMHYVSPNFQPAGHPLSHYQNPQTSVDPFNGLQFVHHNAAPVPQPWHDIPSPPAPAQQVSPLVNPLKPQEDAIAGRFCRIGGCRKYSATRKDCHRHRDTHFPGRYRCPNAACQHAGKRGAKGTFPRADTLIRHWDTKCQAFAVPADQVEATCCIKPVPYWYDHPLDPYDPAVHVLPKKVQEKQTQGV